MPDETNGALALLEEGAKEAIIAPANTIGSFLSDILYLKFGHHSLAANKQRIVDKLELERYEQSLRAKMEATPEEKRVEPDLQIAGQALEASLFCLRNETVREMFENLIASTVNCDTAGLAHPSFPEKIKQMSSFDAQLLYIFKDKTVHPICQYKSVVNKQGGYEILATNIFLSGNCDCLTDTINKRSAAIDLLSHLGLIAVSYSEYLTNEILYERFTNVVMYQHYCIAEKEKGNNVELQKGLVRLTPLGKRLLTVCCP